MLPKNKALKIVNVVLLILLFNQWIGSTVYPGISHDLFEWGHERAGILLVIMAIVHLILNWNWVKANYFKKK